MTDVLKDKSGILIEGHIKIYDPKAILKDNYKNCLQVTNMLSAIKNTNLIISIKSLIS